MRSDRIALLALSLAVPIALVACSKDESKSPPPASAAHEEHAAPHGGEVLELGAEVAHLEIVHDPAAGKVTVYVLDKDVKTPVAVAAPTITIRTKDGNQEVAMAAISPAADGTANAWTATHDGFKADPLDGRIRVAVRGTAHQSPLEPEGHSHK